MHYGIIAVTHDGQLYVRTVITIMRINMMCSQKGISKSLMFVRDTEEDIRRGMETESKRCDRILFLDYGVICEDDETLEKFIAKELNGGQVMPAVKEGVNWDKFREKVLTGIKEPLSQMGLEFDTEVDEEGRVKKTEPKMWALDVASIRDHLLTLPLSRKGMFEELMFRGVNIECYQQAKVMVVYPHECIGNIMALSRTSQQDPFMAEGVFEEFKEKLENLNSTSKLSTIDPMNIEEMSSLYFLRSEDNVLALDSTWKQLFLMVQWVRSIVVIESDKNKASQLERLQKKHGVQFEIQTEVLASRPLYRKETTMELTTEETEWEQETIQWKDLGRPITTIWSTASSVMLLYYLLKDQPECLSEVKRVVMEPVLSLEYRRDILDTIKAAGFGLKAVHNKIQVWDR